MTTSTSLVTGIDYVSIPTNDLPRAREFYEQVLELPPSSLWQRPGEEPLGAELEPGTVTLALVDCQALGIPFSPNAVPIALHVDDVAAARAALEERGVTFVAGTLDSGVCHMAHFRDPDGNALVLHQRYAPKGL